MEIHQILVAASPGDAITNNAMQIRKILREVTQSEIYARYINDELIGDVHPLHEFDRRGAPRPRHDLLVFHASIGEPDVLSFLLERRERLVVIYHNISPSAPFLAYDAAFAGLLDGGRRELELLAPRAVLGLGVSSYNVDELHGLGYADARLSPLIVDAASLVEVEPDAATTNHLETQVKGPVVLFVGQLLPHKRPDFLIKAFHVMATNLAPDAHLILVGADIRLPRYVDALRHLVNELNLTGAWITGSVPVEQLVAFYRRADVFVTASEHEGFCVPLLEAMAFETPIVARAFGAIPETMGAAGLLLPPEAGTVLAAEAITEMVGNDRLRDTVVRAGRHRLNDFTPEHASAVLVEHLLSVA